MVSNKIGVRMGEGAIAMAPDIISSVGLGSCVVVTLHDPQSKIGGLAHIMLPKSGRANGYHGPFQCADSGIAHLVKEMQRMGASLRDLVAKMVGGAQMFSSEDDSRPGVGERNIMSIKEILRRNRVPLISHDIGGNHGRSVVFYLNSGNLIVSAFGKKEIKI
jgi:chemotaxis protein CheD